MNDRNGRLWAFRLGAFMVRPSSDEIVGPNGSTKVEPKMMEVLEHLVRHAGSVVSRNELLDQVWADTHVGERVLTRVISELRRVLGDDPAEPRYVETVIKRGYRLVASVEFVDAEGQSIEELSTVRRPPTGGSGSTQGGTTVRRLPIALAAVLVAVAVATVWSWHLRSGSGSVPSVEVRPLTTYPSWEYDPELSPDGQAVAFAWHGAEQANWDVYVRDLGAEKPMRLTDHEGAEGSPVWSPDGRRIAYYNSRPGPPRTCELLVRPVLGGEPTSLGPCAANYPKLSWSPDGRLLAFNERTGVDRPHRIVILDLESRRRRVPVEPPPTAWGDYAASFSPAGDRLAFTRVTTEGDEDVYVIRIDGTDLVRVTADHRSIRRHDWLDANRLVVSSSRSGFQELWEFPVAEGGAPPTRIAAGRGVSGPTARRGRIVAEQWNSDTDILTAELPALGGGAVLTSTGGGPTLRAWARSTAWDMSPAIAPQGGRAVFVSNRSGHHELWVAGRNGDDERRLTSFEGSYLSTPRFAPDGRTVMFEARPEGQADIYAVSVDGGPPTRLTDHPADDLAPWVSPGGEWLYFASARTGAWEVWRRSLQEDRSEQVTMGGGFAPVLSEDGETLYFTHHLRRGLWSMPVDGGVAELVHRDLEDYDWGSWAIRGGTFYTLRRGDYPTPDVLAAIDLRTGGVRELLEVPRAPHGDVALAIAPDGSWALLGNLASRGADLILIEPVDRAPEGPELP